MDEDVLQPAVGADEHRVAHGIHGVGDAAGVRAHAQRLWRGRRASERDAAGERTGGGRVDAFSGRGRRRGIGSGGARRAQREREEDGAEL